MTTKYFDLIFVVTSRNINLTNCFIDNLKKIYNNNVSLLLIYICQNIEFDNLGLEFDCVVIHTELMGLSKARNVAIDYLSENQISSKYIMFPDDDSSFDISFFKIFPSILNYEKLNFITPIYNKGSKDLYIGYDTITDTYLNKKDIRVVGSPNQILNYTNYKSIIYFDTDLGVGAKYGSSEDHDLFYRLINNGAKFKYIDKLYSFHPKKINNYYGVSIRTILNRFINYSRGFAFVNFKHRVYSHFPNYLYRTLLASIFYLFKMEFKLFVAYLFQFFVRIYFILYFTSNRNYLNENPHYRWLWIYRNKSCSVLS